MNAPDKDGSGDIIILQTLEKGNKLVEKMSSTDINTGLGDKNIKDLLNEKLNRESRKIKAGLNFELKARVLVKAFSKTVA